MTGWPTPYPEVNSLVQMVHDQARAILQDNFRAMYLDGSLAYGDFDSASDIDFMVITAEEVGPELFLDLQAMHAKITNLGLPFAMDLEGSYISERAIRRYDPALCDHPNLERGPTERLKMLRHAEDWDIHRHILTRCGIVVAGPPPPTFIDPVSPAQLRQAMRTARLAWLEYLRDHPQEFPARGYQSYIVLTICRMLYTLHFGEVVSKPTALRWARTTLGETWTPCLDRAWEGRQNPGLAAEAEDIAQTLDLIGVALARLQSSA